MLKVTALVLDQQYVHGYVLLFPRIFRSYI